MIILEYKCNNCLTIFEHAITQEKTKCISCKSENIKQNNEIVYKPNKVFCRKSKTNREYNKNWATKLAPTLQYNIGECDSCTLN